MTLSEKSKTKWGLNDEGDQLWFLSDDLCLFQLGEYREGDLKFSVEIEQTSWVGGIGLFWAHRSWRERPGWRQLETFQLNPSPGSSLQLCNSIFKYSETASHWTDSDEISLCRVDAEGEQKHRIGFEFKKGALVRLEWDSMDLSPLVSKRAEHPVAQEPSFGTFGVINKRSHGTYSHPLVDGRRVSFNVAIAQDSP